MTDEHAMKVWREACGAYEDNSHDLTLSIRERTIAGDQAATAVLAREFEADRARIEALEAELSRLKRGEWFYLAGDMSSDKCRFSPYEVIDEDWLYDNRSEGDRVIEIEVATPLPSIWCAVHFFSNEEKDARQSDDAYEFTEHPTEEAARAALKDTSA